MIASFQAYDNRARSAHGVRRATTTAIGAPARIAAAGLALACVAIGGFLAAHYPYSPRIVLALFLVWIAVAWRYPLALLVALPAALPVIDFAPWTGRIVFEEWDMVVLGAAAGGYLGLAFGVAESPDSTKRSRGNPAGVVLFVLFGLSGIIALYRGFADAGGLHFGWSQGYYDPLNSLRVFKGFIAAMLLAPLALRQIRRSPRAISRLALGLALGCGAASLYVLWERAAFPGVLNFSSDYRTTGSFWEMHVGGAALDGFLALTLPFALWSALRARNPVQALACALLVALAFYASLVTFSRGVYLAIPFSLGTLAVLLHRRGAASAKGARAIGLRDFARRRRRGGPVLSRVSSWRIPRAGGGARRIRHLRDARRCASTGWNPRMGRRRHHRRRARRRGRIGRNACAEGHLRRVRDRLRRGRIGGVSVAAAAPRAMAYAGAGGLRRRRGSRRRGRAPLGR